MILKTRKTTVVWGPRMYEVKQYVSIVNQYELHIPSLLSDMYL